MHANKGHMSSFLYTLGTWAAKARWLVLSLWLLVLAGLGAGAIFFSQGANAPITIPGTESQAALETLRSTFPEVSGTSAQIIVVAAEGDDIESEPYRQALIDAADDLEGLPNVTAVAYPFAEQAAQGLADDGQAALITIQIQGTMDQVPDALDEGIRDTSAGLQEALPEGTQTSVGGEIYSAEVPGLSPTEAVGVIIAFIVLVLTLGSLIAAGMPLLIALIGVGISVAGIFFVTAFVELTSTTPMLALMLGLAVGIDYTLFIVSRHQEQLLNGVPVTESIARATATSGSAVVFAGLTVVIALVGLSVAGIPFLTALGVAAAAAVALSVVIAVTLTPAILAMAGPKILRKKERRRIAAAAASAGDVETATGEAQPSLVGSRLSDRFFGRWVKVVTAKPLITSVLVLIVLGIATVPALQLRLALPNASGLEENDPARVTYELTAEHFGEGANGPLVLAGSIITSTDPLGLMEDLADEVRAVPGVADVPLATPNQGADTGIIQVVPEEGPHAASTGQLVHDLRDKHDEWQERYGVSLSVTGFTAVGIDVSELLFKALIPFSVLVVGLSLILLAMVFRSVWVPTKATLGYLLSVGAAFGAVVAVFQWGWLGDALNVHATGPILSFMPIILMGVLFGLAMDYEVFLVSRIREEVVHGADSQAAIHRGFIGSGKVVSAAAIIMFAVFAAFVPQGDPSIKVIALGLAVGVFVDAFIVRMVLVPAILSLLGDRAWRMPRWLDRLLPHFDVEGEGLTREITYAEWPADDPAAVIASERLVMPGNRAVPELRVQAGEALVLDPADPVSEPLARVLSGRGQVSRGTLKVHGLLQPDRAATLRKRSAWVPVTHIREATKDRPDLLVITGVGPALSGRDAEHAHGALAAWAIERERATGKAPTVIIVADIAQATRVLPRALSPVTPGAPNHEHAAAGMSKGVRS